MKVLIDACVLYPTILREIVLGFAREGGFTPLWSPRILGEWVRAVEKLGAEQVAVAEGEVALLRAAWPEAEVALPDAADGRFWLPDPNDIHVLEAAVAGGADLILTLNLKDFPKRELAPHGVSAIHPDAYLSRAYGEGAPVAQVVKAVLAQAAALSPEPIDAGKIMKRARLPRLRKAMIRGDDLADPARDG